MDLRLSFGGHPFVTDSSPMTSRSLTSRTRTTSLPSVFLRLFTLLLFVLFKPLPVAKAQDLNDSWAFRWSQKYRDTVSELLQARQEQQQLPALLRGQTVPRLGYLHPRLNTPPPTPAWVQIDLGTSSSIDAVTLIPTQADWASSEEPAYAFPRRFHVETSENPDFKDSTLLAAFDTADFRNPGITPVTLRKEAIQGRFVRITFTQLAEDKGEFVCSLGEVMVIRGNRNIALGCAVTGSATTELPGRWSLAFLTDGQSALGPPIEQNLLPYDGLYTGSTADGSPAFIEIDLGKSFPIQEVRMHPIHARIGSNIAGWAFPKRFKVALSNEDDFAESKEISSFISIPAPNPGANPVILPAGDQLARYIKVSLIEAFDGMNNRFGLSEIEVFSGDRNVASGARVKAAPDGTHATHQRPLSLLVDGFASSGKLMDLPKWLAKWEKRRLLEHKQVELTARCAQIESDLQTRFTRLGVLFITALIGSGAYFFTSKKPPLIAPTHES